MNTIVVIIAVLVVAGGGIWVATKYFGAFKDNDKDGIPDKVEDTAKEVKRRAKRVKEELKDVVEAAKDVADQAGDIAGAVKGKPRKGRKPRAKKASK